MKALKTMVGLALMVLATMAPAEQRHLFKPTVTVPFNFKVAEKVLPAGDYQVRVEGAALILTGRSGENVMAVSPGVQSQVPAEQSHLEFVNNGGIYQLYRVWQAGYNAGRELSLPKSEKRVAQQDVTTRVPMGK